MEKVKNTPSLRFPEFNGDWEKKKLGEVAKFSKGKGISKSEISDDGINECIRYGELYTRYGEVIIDVFSKTNFDINKSVVSEANDVIIPASGETQIDIATASCVMKSGVILGGDLNIIKTNKNGVFLSYYLNSKRKLDIANLAQGISVVHLYSSQLSLLNLNFPTLLEQQKIATFLTAVDEKLQALKQKKTLLEQYKKGVMQQIFSQELRFTDDNGNDFEDWEEKKLGEVCKLQGGFAFKSNLFKKSGTPVIRISNISNHNNHIELNNVVYYDKVKNDENFIIKNGDLLLAMSGATTGKSSIYNLNYDSYLNQRVGLFKTKTKQLYYPFLTQFVFSVEFEKQLDSVLVAGAQPNISSSNIENFEFPFPSLEEQTKIANFLSAIDEKINLCQAQIEKTEIYKKGLLQKMFV